MQYEIWFRGERHPARISCWGGKCEEATRAMQWAVGKEFAVVHTWAYFEERVRIVLVGQGRDLPEFTGRLGYSNEHHVIS